MNVSADSLEPMFEENFQFDSIIGAETNKILSEVWLKMIINEQSN